MKKRLLTMLLAFAMLTTCIPFVALAAEFKDEAILYYDDFEGEKFTGVLNNNVSASTTDEEAYAGSKALKVTGYSRTYDMGPEYALTNKAKQGHTYEVSFWAKVPEGEDPMKIRLKLSYTRNGTTSYPNLVGEKEINGDEWTLFKGSYTFTMPLEEVTGINIYMETFDEYVGTAYFVDEYIVRDTLAAEPTQPEDKRVFTDVPPNLQGSAIGEAVEFLSALNICNYTGKEELSLEDKMTRTAFGDIIEKFYADPSVVSNFKEIAPSDFVTYQDAARAFVNVLGYDLIVKNSQTRAYFAMAAEIGLLEGLKVNATDGALVTDILTMLYNMTEISPLRHTVVGNPSQYGVDREKTIYSELFGMYKARGVVTGTYMSKLADESNLTPAYVEIDNVAYSIGNTKTDDYLGLGITYYYIDDFKAGSKTLIAVNEYRNNIVEFTSDEIIAYNNGEYKYFNENGKEDKISIPVEASIIYNGQFKANVTNDELYPSDGVITFIDSNRNGDYETIKIEDTKYVTVDRVDIYKVAFYCKNGEVIEFDPYDNNTLFDIRDTSGKVVKLSTIMADDLLAIRESKSANKHFISITVLKETVEGTVSGLLIADKYTSQIKVDEQTYSLTSSLVAALANNAADKPSVGNRVCVYLTENGKVGAVKILSVTDLYYAYVIDAKMGTKAFDKNLMLKMLTPDGEISEFKTADKVIVDGTRVDGDSLVVETSFCPGGAAINQMVGYRTDAEGKIVALDTTNTDETKETSISLNEVYNTGTNTATYYSRAGRIFGTMEHILADDATVYLVPNTDSSDELLYEVGTVSLLSNSSSYKVKGYSTRGLDFVSDLLIVYTDRGLSYSSSVMLVNEVTQVVNKDGEARTKITGLVKNSENSIVVDDRTTTNFVSTIIPGDIIRYRTSANGEVIAKDEVNTLSRIAKVNENDLPEIVTTSTSYSGLYYNIGTVTKMQNGYMEIQLSGGTKLHVVPGQFNISRYDAERGVYEANTQGAIVDAETNPENPSTVFIRTRQRYAEEMIIFD